MLYSRPCAIFALKLGSLVLFYLTRDFSAPPLQMAEQINLASRKVEKEREKKDVLFSNNFRKREGFANSRLQGLLAHKILESNVKVLIHDSTPASVQPQSRQWANVPILLT